MSTVMPSAAQAVTGVQNPPATTPLPEGFVTIATSPSCSVPDGGFLRTWAEARFDVSASMTGKCDIYIFDVYHATETRNILGIAVLPLGPLYPTTYTQTVDSRVPGATVPEGRGFTLMSEGQAVMDFASMTAGSVCGWPISSTVAHFTVNGMNCKPTWFVDPVDTINYHAPLGTIEIRVPSAFMTAYAPAVAAAASWSAALGRTITVVPNATCSTGNPLCVGFMNDHGTRPGDSGCASLETASYNPSGEWIASTAIRFEPNWTGAYPDNLQRTISHELGHYFGLGDRLNPSCGQPDTVMGPTSCYGTGAPPVGTLLGPSSSDAASVTNSTYGNRVRATCGW